MLTTLKRILAIITIVLAGYGLMFQNDRITLYMMFCLGTMTLVMGINEIKEERKRIGIFNIFVSIFVYFVMILVS